MTPLLRGFLELAFPHRCADCERPLRSRSHALCEGCAERLPWLDAENCALCQGVWVGEPGALCGGCRGDRSPLRACTAATAYGGETERWIHRFKYPSGGLSGADARARAVLRELVRHAAEQAADRADWIVPIPLHRSRLLQRGFNPAATLAREVARCTGAKLAHSALRRIRDTPSQTGLGRKERRRNVSGAFEAARRVPARVCLVDDVVTTGSTLEDAARALKRAGAKQVTAVCVARTPAPG